MFILLNLAIVLGTPSTPSFLKSFLLLTARTPVTPDFFPNLLRQSSGFLLLVLSHLSRPQMLNSPKAQFLEFFPLGKLIQSHSYKRICTLVTPKFVSLPDLPRDFQTYISNCPFDTCQIGFSSSTNLKLNSWLPIPQLPPQSHPHFNKWKLHPFRTKS